MSPLSIISREKKKSCETRSGFAYQIIANIQVGLHGEEGRAGHWVEDLKVNIIAS
jgi:hypothetical protein